MPTSTLERRLVTLEAAQPPVIPPRRRTLVGAGDPDDGPGGRNPKPFPDIVTFITGKNYLDQVLYPRQATILKILSLDVDNLTDYDRQVIAEWESGYGLIEDDSGKRYAGKSGLAPGTIERMVAARARGRFTLREPVLVFGRRGGKGVLCARMIGYIVGQLIHMGDPQKKLNVERGKDLSVIIVAGGLDQAKSNLFRDVLHMIETAPYFRPYIASKGTKHIRLRTPADIERDPNGPGSIVIDARASTPTSGRGPAAVAVVFDEMAYASSTGLQRGADEVYRGAKPALMQFPTLGTLILASSPASQTGEFYEAYLRALELDSEGEPKDATTMMMHLPSWAPYEDWELTLTGLDMLPEGPSFEPLVRAIVADDEEMQRERNANSDAWEVEYNAQWRSGPRAYLDRGDVEAMFGLYLGEPMYHKYSGVGGLNYVIHCDPSKVGANFAVAIGHLDGDRASGHVLFDHLRVFKPAEFPDKVIDYAAVEEFVYQMIASFRPSIVTFDQYNSIQIIQNLNWKIRNILGYHDLTVTERSASAGNNWKDAELFKLLLSQHRIHAPEHELAKLELLFIEENNQKVKHPDTGPVRTDDLFDAMTNVVAHLMSGDAEVHSQLSDLNLGVGHLSNFRSIAARDVFYDGPPRGEVRGGSHRGYNRARPGRRPGHGYRW